MGNIMRIPIQPAPTSFLHWNLFNPAGEPMKEEEWQWAPGQELVNTEAFYIIAYNFCKPLYKERMRITAIKNKFLDANIELLTIKFPFWTSDQIRDLKAEFQLFDTKKTGIITYEGLNKILDDIGDKNAPEKRKKLFLECDEDEKSSLDFEEYLNYMALISGEAQKKRVADGRKLNVASKTYGSGAVRRLSILNQISSGIF